MKKHKNINMLGCCLIAAFSFLTFSVAKGQNQKHLNTEKENNINNDKVIKVSPISQDQTNVDLLKGQEKNNLLLINNKNDEAKKVWINNNPDTYLQMGGTTFTINNSINERKVNAQNVTANNEQRMPEYSPLPEISSFPNYYNTGNKAVDDANYKVNKDQWILQNRSAYKFLNQVNNSSNSSNRVNSIINK